MASLRTPQVVTKEVVAASFGFYKSEEVRGKADSLFDENRLMHRLYTLINMFGSR